MYYNQTINSVIVYLREICLFFSVADFEKDLKWPLRCKETDQKVQASQIETLF